MTKPVHAFLAAIAFAATSAVAADAPPAASDVVARVTRDGSTFNVQAEFTVAASLELVWDVITDFDHMAQILSNVDQSHIVSRDGNVIQVAQKSHTTAGLVRLSTESLREIELTPLKQLHSRLLKGDVKSSEFTTRISDEGGGITKLTVDGKFVAGSLTAGVITPETVEGQTKKQYQELRDEVLRRKAKAPPPGCQAMKNCPQSSG